MEFDKGTYERQQSLAQRETIERLRSIPAFGASLDSWGRGPAVTLECAKGHRLLAILGEDLDDRLLMRPANDHAVRTSSAVTYHAEPWRDMNAVCRTPGCPAIIEYDGFCDDHGSKRLEVIGYIRTGFYCRQCMKRVGEVTTVRLIKLYAVAVVMGTDHIAIADTPQAARPV